MDIFEGFNFRDCKDFEVHYARRKAAVALFADYCRLGYDSYIVYQYLLRFVAGFLSPIELNSLISYRCRCLRDYGTPFPEEDPSAIVDLFTVDCFEIGVSDGKFNGVPVLDELCLFTSSD